MLKALFVGKIRIGGVVLWVVEINQTGYLEFLRKMLIIHLFEIDLDGMKSIKQALL